MITKFKIFENSHKPKINDFIVIKIKNGDYCIGYITDLLGDDRYNIKYFPTSGGNFDDIIHLNNIIYFSDNDDEFEDYIRMLKNTEKYNL